MITEKEFTDLYNAYAPKVFRLCLGYASGDEDLAKEWVQETFIKVWNHRNSFKGNAAAETWIYRIAVNTCLSDLRKSKKNIHVHEGLTEDHTEEVSENNETQIRKLYSCIDQLTKKNKALILLELEDIPQATIAETVGIAHGTLRTRLSRIRQALLKCMTNGK